CVQSVRRAGADRRRARCRCIVRCAGSGYRPPGGRKHARLLRAGTAARVPRSRIAAIDQIQAHAVGKRSRQTRGRQGQYVRPGWQGWARGPRPFARRADERGTDAGMSDWAYSTQGFERIVHRIDGVETVTYAIGSGKPLVYFHGGGTFHGFEWMRPLADGFRVYCPYHPNFGESGDADFEGIGDYVTHYEMLFA